MPPFLVYRWLIPLVFRNSVLVPKFISLIFSFFLLKKRERVIRFWWKERKWLLITISATKMVETSVNEFRLTRKVSLGFFFGFLSFFFFEVMNMFIKVFFRSLEWKWVDKWVFKQKNNTLFFRWPHRWILYKTNDASSVILLKKKIKANPLRN